MAAEFDFHPLAEHHLPQLHAWLCRPHVAAWWGEADPVDELREHFLSGGSTRAFIAHLGNEPAGFIQCYVVMGSGEGWWPDETDPGARGIDQFLADEARLNQGLGRAMVRAFVARLFEDPAVTVVQTDPSPDNPRAIRCYAAAGFVPVGPVTTPDGPALLMRCLRPTAELSNNASGDLAMLHGHCHCGALSWTFRGLPDSATACNCTVCRRYGTLWAYDHEGEGITVSGPSRAYVRGQAIEFHFCPTCGCMSHWRAREPGEDGRRRIAVNLRLTEPGPVARVPIEHFDGLDSFDDLGQDGRCVGDYWF